MAKSIDALIEFLIGEIAANLQGNVTCCITSILIFACLGSVASKSEHLCPTSMHVHASQKKYG